MIMKKFMVMMTLGLILFSGSVFAQTAPNAGSDAKDKKETIKSKPIKQNTAVGVKSSSTGAQKAKIKGNTSKKEAVKSHKDEIKAKADSKEEAKEMIQDKKAGHQDATQKDKVKAHKDEIKAKADSKEEAKAKLQRKHDKNKNE